MPQGPDADKVFTRATNGKGFSSSVRISFPPDVSEAISALVATRLTPYKTNADFYRDAAHHRMKYWQDKVDDPEFIRQASLSDRLAQAESMRVHGERERALVESRSSELQGCYGDPERVQLILDEIDTDLQFVEIQSCRDQLIALVDRYLSR